MSSRVRSHIRGNVIGYVALFFALSGGAYAAGAFPAGSVGTKQLKKGAVTNSKLANGAVTGSKVAKNSLTGKQIKASTLGTVPNAAHANSATNATQASTATNALTLGGQPAASFETAGHFQTSGVVALSATGGGNTQLLLTVGPITYTERCTATGGANFKGEILESTTEPGAVVAGPNGESVLAASPQTVDTFTSAGAGGANFLGQVLTPSGVSYQESEFVAVHSAGHDCVARINAFVP